MAGKNGSARVKQADIDEILGTEAVPEPIDFDARRNDEEVEERVVIFHLNGTDYSVPKKPRINLGLKFSYERRAFGTDVAVSSLLRAMLGDEGFDALMGYDGLTEDDLEAITTICSRAAMGKLEAQKAK